MLAVRISGRPYGGNCAVARVKSGSRKDDPDFIAVRDAALCLVTTIVGAVPEVFRVMPTAGRCVGAMHFVAVY